MPPALRVPFGLKEGQLYEPRQVLNGGKCGCVCPACKRPLVAKQKATTPHFAHAPGEDCANALETALHLAAKQLIATRMELRLPEVKFFNHWAEKSGFQTISVEQLVKVSHVAIEPWLDDFRPDLAVTIGEQAYLVEIAVTHFVDEPKFNKIRARKIPTIEIDASALKRNFTFSALAELLFTSTYPASWLYHPRTEELAQEAMEKYQAEEERKVALIHLRRKRFDKYRALSPSEKLAHHCRKLALTPSQLRKLTNFVAWENSFGTSREVWQSAVLVYLQKAEADEGWDEVLGTHFYLDNCLNWLRQIFTIKVQVENADRIALWKYFQYLESLGIVEHYFDTSFYLRMSATKWVDLISANGDRPRKTKMIDE